mmetsp:Transcript_47371/g.138066  ORF Transcript_47371/g.138066 Transcript_47371/m.138066 type:complete len:463 (+) Transcript_47371:650-2038(+)
MLHEGAVCDQHDERHRPRKAEHREQAEHEHDLPQQSLVADAMEHVAHNETLHDGHQQGQREAQRISQHQAELASEQRRQLCAKRHCVAAHSHYLAGPRSQHVFHRRPWRRQRPPHPLFERWLLEGVEGLHELVGVIPRGSRREDVQEKIRRVHIFRHWALPLLPICLGTGHRPAVCHPTGVRSQQDKRIEQRSDLLSRLVNNNQAQDSEAFCNNPEGLDANLRICRGQARRWLVAEEQRGVGGHAAGEADAAPLTAGDAAHLDTPNHRLRDVIQREGAQKHIDPSVHFVVRATGLLLQGGVELDGFANLPVRRHQVFLAHIGGDAPETSIAQAAVDSHFAAVLARLLIRQDVEQCCLAAAAGAHDGDDLAILEVPATGLQDNVLGPAAPGGQREGYILKGEACGRQRVVRARDISRRWRRVCQQHVRVLGQVARARRRRRGKPGGGVPLWQRAQYRASRTSP